MTSCSEQSIAPLFIVGVERDEHAVETLGFACILGGRGIAVEQFR